LHPFRPPSLFWFAPSSAFLIHFSRDTDPVLRRVAQIQERPSHSWVVLSHQMSTYWKNGWINFLSWVHSTSYSVQHALWAPTGAGAEGQIKTGHMRKGDKQPAVQVLMSLPIMTCSKTLENPRFSCKRSLLGSAFANLWNSRNSLAW
jgi:hypothetical protein